MQAHLIIEFIPSSIRIISGSNMVYLMSSLCLKTQMAKHMYVYFNYEIKRKENVYAIKINNCIMHIMYIDKPYRQHS